MVRESFVELFNRVERETISEKRGSRKEKAAAEREKERENEWNIHPMPSVDELLEDRKVRLLHCCAVLHLLHCML